MSEDDAINAAAEDDDAAAAATSENRGIEGDVGDTVVAVSATDGPSSPPQQQRADDDDDDDDKGRESEAAPSGTMTMQKHPQLAAEPPRWRFVNTAKKSLGYSSKEAGTVVGLSAEELADKERSMSQQGEERQGPEIGRVSIPGFLKEDGSSTPPSAIMKEAGESLSRRGRGPATPRTTATSRQGRGEQEQERLARLQEVQEEIQQMKSERRRLGVDIIEAERRKEALERETEEVREEKEMLARGEAEAAEEGAAEAVEEGVTPPSAIIEEAGGSSSPRGREPATPRTMATSRQGWEEQEEERLARLREVQEETQRMQSEHTRLRVDIIEAERRKEALERETQEVREEKERLARGEAEAAEEGVTPPSAIIEEADGSSSRRGREPATPRTATTSRQGRGEQEEERQARQREVQEETQRMQSERTRLRAGTIEAERRKEVLEKETEEVREEKERLARGAAEAAEEGVAEIEEGAAKDERAAVQMAAAEGDQGAAGGDARRNYKLWGIGALIFVLLVAVAAIVAVVVTGNDSGGSDDGGNDPSNLQRGDDAAIVTPRPTSSPLPPPIGTESPIATAAAAPPTDGSTEVDVADAEDAPAEAEMLGEGGGRSEAPSEAPGPSQYPSEQLATPTSYPMFELAKQDQPGGTPCDVDDNDAGTCAFLPDVESKLLMPRDLGATQNRMFGSSVTFVGDTGEIVAVGSGAEDSAVHIYRNVYHKPTYPYLEGYSQWEYLTSIEPPNDAGTTSQVLFGASLDSNDEGYIVVGAPYSSSNVAKGLAFVYRPNSNFAEWDLAARLAPGDEDDGGIFGSNVAFDGNLIAVGSPGERNGKGSVYVFERTGNAWIESATLSPEDVANGARFGSSVSLHSDAPATLAVGAPGDSGGGVAFVYKRSGLDWLPHRLTSRDVEEGDDFGSHVVVSGCTVAVSSPKDGTISTTGAGTVRIFNWDADGEYWAHRQIVEPNDEIFGAVFGQCIAMEGNTLLVGSQWGGEGTEKSGVIYHFKRTNGLWTKISVIPNKDYVPGDADRFGCPLALSGDSIVVGARGDSTLGPSGGSAFIYDICPAEDNLI